MSLDYSMIPEHCRDSMRAYIEDGCPVGSFLTAVLENNLVEAFSRADDTNRAAMIEYARFLYLEAPRDRWGSRDQVRAWLEACAEARERLNTAKEIP